MKLHNQFKIHGSVFADTNLFIYVLEAHSEFGLISAHAIDFFIQQKLSLFTSIMSVSELLIKPYQLNQPERANYYVDSIRRLTQNILTPDFNTSVKVAQMRAKYHFSLADSFQLALAEENKCDYFLTNDKGLKKYRGIKIVLLSELEV